MMTTTLRLSACVLALTAGAAMAQQTSITVGMQLEPPMLDPTAGAAAAIDEVVYSNVFEGLTRFASDGSIIEGLAEDWVISDDGTRYVFSIRDGVTFHDGEALTASDVVFSLDRARAEGSVNAQAALFENIVSVEAEDDLTVVITLDGPDGAFLFDMAWGDAVIVDPASAESNATNPIGTGAFAFEEWRQGDSVTLTRYDDYWGEAPALTDVTFRFISDPSAALAAMMAGDLDAFPVFPAPENLALFEADPRFNVIVGSTEGETILAMNNGAEPLNNPLIRQAITHAINRQDIIDGAMFGYGTPIGTHFAPHNPDYVDLTEASAFDPDRARELLAEAGAGNLTLRMMLPPPSYARRGGEIIASQLRDVGINTEITNLEWSQWLEQVFRGYDFDLTIVSHTEPADINIYARPEYYFQYDSADFQALMAELAVTTDPAERTRINQTAQRMISDEYVNAYLFQLAKTGVADARIEGLWANAPTQANDMTGVRWTE